MFKSLALAGLIAMAAALATGANAREVTHAMGTTEVPDAPQRIVILTNEGTEALLDLGFVPVGAAQSWNVDPWYPHIAEALADTTSLGTELAINLELVAALEPDLIIGTKVRQEKIYEQLSAIAPTVMSETIGETWLENYEFYGEVLGVGDRARENVAALKARAAALGSAVGEAISEEISLVRFSPGRTRIYYRATYPGMIFDMIGFKRPAAQDRTDNFEEVQKERIPDMAGDRIFYFSADTDPEEARANLEDWIDDPLWNNLEAVKAGKAQRVSEDIWNAAGGILAAHIMLDQIAEIYGVAIPE